MNGTPANDATDAKALPKPLHWFQPRDGGAIVVRGSRVSLSLLLECIRRAEDMERIQQRFPSIPNEAV